MRSLFRALRSRNYRLFFGGQTLSLIGTWMQSVAMSWLVYRLTGSELLLGTVQFASQIPMFVVSPFAGVLSDRVDRRRLMILTQSLAMAQAGVLAWLAYSGRVQVWQIVALSIFIGIVNAFDTPARQAFVVEIVEDRKDLPNAIALNSTQFNIARLIGPAIAGLTIRAAGEAACFFINTVSFCAVVAALVAMRVTREPRESQVEKPGQQLLSGARYAWRSQPIRALLLLMAIMSFASGAYQVLLPVYAKEVFHGDSGTLGYLYGAVGVGALVAAVMLAGRKSVIGLARWIVISSIVFSLSLAAFGLTRSFWFGAIALAFLGFGSMKQMGSTNTMIQTVVEDQMRGRVMAFYVMSFVGTIPIGSLIAGLCSSAVGAPATLIGAGAIAILGSMNFARTLPRLRSELRPIYEAKGILARTT